MVRHLGSGGAPLPGAVSGRVSAPLRTLQQQLLPLARRSASGAGVQPAPPLAAVAGAPIKHTPRSLFVLRRRPGSGVHAKGVCCRRLGFGFTVAVSKGWSLPRPLDF